MALLSRPMRAMGAFAIIVLIILISQHASTNSRAAFPDPIAEPVMPETKGGVPGILQTSPDAAIAPPPAGVAQTVQHGIIVGSHESAAADYEKLGLSKDAHKFAKPDDFRAHFKAITELPGLTMADAKAGCPWIAPGNINFQYNTADDWVVNDRPDTELEKRRKEWQKFILNDLKPWGPEAHRFEGRGIVIVAGNNKSLMLVRVILKALSALQSSLPIEIHYWGDELNLEKKKAMKRLWPNKMFFNDLKSTKNFWPTNHDGLFINYQLKTAAILNSRFAEPLLLDSDNIPVLDPATLYDTEEYKEFGTLFWPDIARTRPNNPMWAITNTPCRMDEYEQESGQLIVDKRRFFYHLQMTAWFNNVHAAYYNEFLLGDKDMFRFTWHALKTRYGQPSQWLTSVGTLSPAPQNYYCGHSFAQHHPDGRVAFMHGGLVKTITKENMQWQREKRGGIFQVYKKSPWNQQHSVIVNVSIKWDGHTYLPNKPPDLPVASCTDFWDVEPRPMSELIPGFERAFETYGGYWKLDFYDEGIETVDDVNTRPDLGKVS